MARHNHVMSEFGPECLLCRIGMREEWERAKWEVAKLEWTKGMSEEVWEAWEKLEEAESLVKLSINKHMMRRSDSSAEDYEVLMDIAEDVALAAYDLTFALEKEKPVDNSRVEEGSGNAGHACKCAGECQTSTGPDIRSTSGQSTTNAGIRVGTVYHGDKWPNSFTLTGDGRFITR